MWLFVVLTLNALFGCYVWQAEAKLKDGECEGQCGKFESCRKFFLTRMVYVLELVAPFQTSMKLNLINISSRPRILR